MRSYLFAPLDLDRKKLFFRNQNQIDLPFGLDVKKRGQMSIPSRDRRFNVSSLLSPVLSQSLFTYEPLFNHTGDKGIGEMDLERLFRKTPFFVLVKGLQKKENIHSRKQTTIIDKSFFTDRPRTLGETGVGRLRDPHVIKGL